MDHLLICARFKFLAVVTGGAVFQMKVPGRSEGKRRESLLLRPDSFTLSNAELDYRKLMREFGN
jgi:hypothetical protein